MADNRTMAELLQSPTEGYEDAIVIPEIAANNFELKHGLINLVQNKQFFGHDKEDPHSHIRFIELRCGWKFLDKMTRECLKIIESKSKARQSRAKAVVAKVSTSSSSPAISSEVSELKDMVRALLLDKKNQSSALAPSFTPAPVKAIEPNCVTCGGTHSYQNCPATSGDVYRDNIQKYVSQAAAANYHKGNNSFRPQMVANQIRPPGSGTLPSNSITNPKEDLKGITTRSGVAYQGPTILTQSKVVKQRTEVTKDQVQTPSSQSTTPVQPLVVQSKTQNPIFEPVVAPVSVPMPNLKPSILYPSRRDNERRRDQANKQIEKFYEIFKDMSFEISFTDALTLMPKFASTLKDLIGNKEKLSKMARTPMNEHCSAWEGLLLPELTPTCMTLELADRSVSKPIGITKDVSIKTGRALIDVHKGELTLRIGNEAITYNLDQTSRYSANYNQMTANKIDVICEEYSQKVLGFSDTTASGNPTPYDDPIVSTTSPTLTLFGDIDFLLFEEADAFLGLEDDPNSLEFNPFYYNPEGDILLLEAILNSEPLPPLPNHKQSMPSYKKELKVCEAKTVKSSVDEPPEGGFTIVENEENELIPTRLVTGWWGTNTIVSSMVFLGIFKFPSTLVIRKKLRSPVPTERLPIDACLSVCSMHRARFKGGIVLGHKISKNGIEVDKAKIDVIAKLPHPTTVKGAVLGQRHKKHFKPIHYASKMMIDAESNYTTTEKEMLAVVYAFKKFRSYLIMNKSRVHTDHSALKYLFAKKYAKARLLRWVLLLQEFDFKILDTKGAENLAADHLSRLENSYENVHDPK
nr:reverse transcriptase domain-containing protein [Tanacetum cinerariifolium]